MGISALTAFGWVCAFCAIEVPMTGIALTSMATIPVFLLSWAALEVYVFSGANLFA